MDYRLVAIEKQAADFVSEASCNPALQNARESTKRIALESAACKKKRKRFPLTFFEIIVICSEYYRSTDGAGGAGGGAAAPSPLPVLVTAGGLAGCLLVL